ncbi:response regulator [Loktanella sp. DJP18]|uniref:response regulator n=1 Tax=Loktanella sp. DJP18 TaxID=3409788 RepID=UPI003BB6A8AE
MRILVADDDPIILDLLQSPMWLGSEHDLTCVTSAAEALSAIYDSRPFDAFLIDVVMPETDGISLCATIRAMSRHSATPIIMITASTEGGVMHRAFAAGATDFVRKPLDGLDLGARINMATMLNASLLRERKARSTLTQLRQRTVMGQDETPFLGVPSGAMSYSSLKADLLSLSPGCHALSLFSLRVASIDLSGDDQAEDDLLQRLAVIGTVATREMQHSSTRLAYVGRGLFAGVTFGRQRERADLLQHRTQKALEAVWREKDWPDHAPKLLVRSLSTLGVWTGATAMQAIADAVKAQSDPRFARPDDLSDRLIGA